MAVGIDPVHHGQGNAGELEPESSAGGHAADIAALGIQGQTFLVFADGRPGDHVISSGGEDGFKAIVRFDIRNGIPQRSGRTLHRFLFIILRPGCLPVGDRLPLLRPYRHRQVVSVMDIDDILFDSIESAFGKC